MVFTLHCSDPLVEVVAAADVVVGESGVEVDVVAGDCPAVLAVTSCVVVVLCSVDVEVACCAVGVDDDGVETVDTVTAASGASEIRESAALTICHVSPVVKTSTTNHSTTLRQGNIGTF